MLIGILLSLCMLYIEVSHFTVFEAVTRIYFLFYPNQLTKQIHTFLVQHNLEKKMGSVSSETVHGFYQKMVV